MNPILQKHLDSLTKQEQKTIQVQIQAFACDTYQEISYPLDPLNEIPPLSKEEQEMGEMAMHDEPFGILLLAGGAGSRLSFDKSKALFPISPMKKKSFLQLFAEHIQALTQKYEADVPIGILLDPSHKQDIANHLEELRYCGLARENVHFLLQREAPYLLDGAWFLSDNAHIAAAPNGNGGLFDAHGIVPYLDMLSQKGARNCFILPIDNPLLFQLCPAQLGRHVLADVEITCSAITREIEKNPMGLFAKTPNGPVIIDYPLIEQFDIPDAFPYGNLNTFCAKISFLKRMCATPLPVHHVIKKTIRFDPSSNEYSEVDATKSEKFITDLTFFSATSSSILLQRDEVYAPVKTREDILDVQKSLLQKDASLLKKQKIQFNHPIELHPKYSYMEPHLLKKALLSKEVSHDYLD